MSIVAVVCCLQLWLTVLRARHARAIFKSNAEVISEYINKRGDLGEDGMMWTINCALS
jgi:hypothetical protein